MDCQHCGQILKSISSLKQHQKTAKYCLLKQNKESPEEYSCIACSAMFTLKSSLYKHLQICKENTPEKEIIRQYKSREKQLVSSYEEKLKEKDITIKEQKMIIKDLQSGYKNQLRMQNKDLQLLVEKAISRPSIINQTTITQIINNMLPITDDYLKEQAKYLTLEHVKNGADGYAKYALDYPLKDRIICTDLSRKKGKYKDSDGNIVSDPEMSKITKRLFSAIKERNNELIDEYVELLKNKLTEFNFSSNNELDEGETISFSMQTDIIVDYITKSYAQKRESGEMIDGLKPELFQQFVKELSTGSYCSPIV